MQNINIVENFFNEKDFGLANFISKSTNMRATHQPQGVYYPNRLKAYPCWETDELKPEHPHFQITLNNLQNKLNFKVKELKTLFRKIYRSELLQSPFHNREEAQIHQDKHSDFAGVLYLDSFSIKDGTRLYSYEGQVEPDIIVGSKPNRLVFYNSLLYHSPGIDLSLDERIIQVMFVKLDKNTDV